jgi:hypothetical protein
VEPAAPQQAAGEELIRRLERNGISLGDTLVAEGLAQRRSAQRMDWCAE